MKANNMKSEHKILIYHHCSENVDKYVKLISEKIPNIDLFPCKDESEIIKYIEKVDIIFSGHTFPVEYLSKAVNLKWIQSMSAGVENYVKSKLVPKNVLLTKLKGVFGTIMSEYVINHILSVTQNISISYNNQRKKKWEPYIVESIRNKIIGIMGLGSIGSYIAYQLHFLCEKIIAIEEQEKKLPFVYREYDISEIDYFLPECDFLVITVPLTRKTEGLIGEKELGKMKKNAYLINISRGPIIQEKALIKFLKENRIKGVSLDVFDEEPLPKENELWNLDNVTITPHVSGPSIPEDIVYIFLENIERYDMGRKLSNIVDLEKGY